MIHRSRFSPCCFLPLLSISVAPLSGWETYGIILAVLGVLLFLELVFLWYNMRYDLTEDGLLIKDGLSAERSIIDYSSIDGIEIRDGVAIELVAGMSYHRIAISVDGKVRVQISPKDREGFVAELERRVRSSKV